MVKLIHRCSCTNSAYCIKHAIPQIKLVGFGKACYIMDKTGTQSKLELHFGKSAGLDGSQRDLEFSSRVLANLPHSNANICDLLPGCDVW